MEQFQRISRKDFLVIIENTKVKAPDFTHKGTSNYRVTSENIMQKKCVTCENWFNVAKYDIKENKWIEIWKEEEYRKLNSGFNSYCTRCEQNKISKQDNLQNLNTSVKKDTVMWRNDLYKYIMVRAVLEDKSKNELLNEIISEEKKRKDVKY